MRVPNFSVMYDGPGDGAGGGPSGAGAGAGAGTGGAASSGAGAGSSNATGDPAGARSSGSSTAASGAAGGPRKFEYTEDRSDWVPRHRFGEVTTRASRAEAERDRFRAMIEAGTGVHIGEAQDPALKQARAEFFQLFPELQKVAEFFEKQGASLTNIIERAPDLVASTDQGWKRHGTAALGSIYTSMAEDFGVEKIEPNSKQGKMLARTFVSWLEDDPANQEAYVSQSPQQVAELFLSDIRSGLFDPIRRVAQAGSAGTAARNAGLPRTVAGGGAGAGAGGRASGPKTEEEVHNAGWETMKQIVAGNRR